VSELRLASLNRTNPRMFRRMGYEPALEARAFRSLAELDIAGCRAALRQLVDGLDFGELRERRRGAVLLLLDLLQKVNRRIHRPATDDAAYQSHRAALIEEFATYDDPEDARSGFLAALERLLAPLSPEEKPSNPLIERAKGYIEQNYHRRLSLSSVAMLLHLSPNYLSRLFRRETGMTLTAYVHRVRLEHARLLLAEGERSISEIAYLVGYQNYRDFYRNFVKFENASPRQVQRRLSPGR
jgi:two-component system response regulator YesN